MKLVVRKDNFVQILYKILDPPKKRRHWYLSQYFGKMAIWESGRPVTTRIPYLFAAVLLKGDFLV